MENQNAKRTLGPWMLTALVMGNMIGSGIFLLPSALAHYGSISILGWVITAIGTLFLGFVFANLAHLKPQTGGPYAYCRDGFGEFIGFLIAYSYWIAILVGNAAVTIASIGYLSVFFPILHDNHTIAFLASSGILWVLTFNNLIGVQQAGRFQLISTILKIAPLLLVAIFGLTHMHRANLALFNVSGESNWHALDAVAALTLWAFIGVESASVPADSVENPKRTIPFATILGTVLAALVYITSSTVIIGIIAAPVLAKSNAPFADAAHIIFGPSGALLIAAGAIISCVGSLNGWLLLQSQIVYAAAKDRLFPTPFAKTDRNQTPYMALILSSIVINLLLALSLRESLVQQFQLFILIAVLASLVPYLYSTMSMILLMKKDRHLFSRSRFITHFIVAILAFIYAFWAVMGSGENIVFLGSLLLFAGIPVFVWLKWEQLKNET